MRFIPREPSAAGFMLLSFIFTLILVHLSLPALALAILLLALHFVSFDEAFYKLKRSLKLALPIILINLIPYLIIPFFFKVNFIVLLIPAFILLAYLFLLKSRDSPHAYVFGSVIPTLTAFIPIYLSDTISLKALLLWYGLAVHVSATAAYIESKLPWRDVSPKTGLLIWLFIIPLILLKPFTAIASIEPSVKFVRNALKDGKIKPTELKRLGWVEMTRFVLFGTLLTLALLLS